MEHRYVLTLSLLAVFVASVLFAYLLLKVGALRWAGFSKAPGEEPIAVCVLWAPIMAVLWPATCFVMGWMH